MYRLLRNLLFLLPAETSHTLALDLMRLARPLGLLRLLAARSQGKGAARTVMGIEFPNPVGLAAGLDKNADYLDALGSLGFGFIEVGTLTPRAQPGNPRPRLFRLKAEQAIINRLGFNNKGIDYAMARIDRSRYRGVLGINIGKNFDTPLEHAERDYLYCLQRCYTRASYVTVNLSSPNTPGLRELQYGAQLEKLLSSLMQERARLEAQHHRFVPLAVKLAPDMDESAVQAIAAILLRHKVDGVIATNTTLDRERVQGSPYALEAGGLSGLPLRDKSTATVRSLRAALGDAIPIIGVGGILSGADARDKIQAGASLLQIYTGFIYRGPALIADIIDALRSSGG